MAGNIPGSGGVALPGVFTDVQTQSRGASVPGGTRISAFIGEGTTSETIISGALGGGKDGLNPNYTSTSGSDGRHFILSQFPVISNRTVLFRNGSPLVGLEEAIDSSSFSNDFDYRIDIDTGRIELQKAHLVDQGGSFYVASASNVGVGSIGNLDLIDDNAPSENWSIRCISVQRNPLNQPIANTAKFIASGSISGVQLDANGNQVIWIANGTVSNNTILEFSISETSTPFREGDSFVIKVSSGVLNKNDTLTATYIPFANINQAVFLQQMDDVTRNFGLASVDNNLSLACQLAFSNGTPGIMCVQAAPSLPRRTSYLLEDSVDSVSTDVDDYIFPLPVGVTPDLESQIHFFIKNPVTNIEVQVLPNKFEYYTLNTTGHATTSQFIFDDTLAPSGYSYGYTVIAQAASISAGLDGYIARDPVFNTKGIFSSPSVTFTLEDVGKTLKIIDATNVANKGSFVIDSVSNGKLYVHTTGFDDFVSENPASFQLINPSTGAAVPDGAATDGTLTAIVSSATATLNSNAVTGVDFSTFSNILSLKLKISGSDDNNGLYDITAINTGTNTITIEKTFVIESSLRYEVLDTDNSSQYIVINHNVVPDGFALRVNIVDAKDAGFFDAGWINALAALETEEIDILAPFPKQTISVIFQNALTHCKTMSTIKNKKERVLFCGAISGLKPENLTGASPAAVEDIGILEGIQGENITDILSGLTEDLTNYSVPDAFGNTFRCVYFYPDQIVVQAGSDNVLIDGFYIAAAAAGYLSGISNVTIPLTNKVLSGFTILKTRQYSPLVLEQLTQAGVTVLQPVQGGGRVIWGLTTTQSGFPEEQEISIVFIRDRIAKSCRGAFAGYIGIPEDDTIIPTLSARALAVLNSFVSQNMITTYKDLTVQRDSVDPRQWDISVRVQPNYPVNFILVKVDIGLI